MLVILSSFKINIDTICNLNPYLTVISVGIKRLLN